MRIILAPAKKMNVDVDSFPVSTLPQFLPETEQLLSALQAMSPQALQKLWKCNDAIDALNVERLARMDLHHRLTPAVMSYEGIAYRYMAPGVMEQSHLDYLREHLRILSGFYGLLRPFDGVTPYRLEMQARLAVNGHRDLYAFWGDRLTRQLEQESNCILNLASVEYSKAIEPYISSGTIFLTCVFGEWRDGKVIEKGTMCKMARGQMVRWLAENHITHLRDLRDFDQLGYAFSPALSREDRLVFLRQGPEPKEP